MSDTIVGVMPDTIANVASQAAHGAIDEAIVVHPRIQLSHTAAESSYAIARMLIDVTDTLLGLVGLEHNVTVRAAVYSTLVILLSVAIGEMVKWVLLQGVHRLARKVDNVMIDSLISVRFFTKLSRLISPLIFLVLIQIAFRRTDVLASILAVCGYEYMIFLAANAICAVITAIYEHFNITRNKKNLPLRGLRQLAVGVVWILAVIFMVSLLVGRSPVALLTGLGAFAAVLMLVFKDSILGVVAGVQLAENDNLRVGDWIQIDGTSANGVVKSVSLVSVKVQNWDKTITTVPPYSLVSGSFKNYRTMQESNTRRIQRCYYVDCDTVRFCTEEMLERYRKIPYMDEYITRKLEEQKSGKSVPCDNADGMPHGSIDTNLGLLRAYLVLYLRNNRSIDRHSTLFVNTLAQTAYGIPLQIYCFTNTSAWVDYEGIQSEIFEHIASILPMFDLYAYEQPSGRDTVNEGYLEASKPASDLYGLPYPFLHRGVENGMAHTPQPGPDAVGSASGSQDKA